MPLIFIRSCLFHLIFFAYNIFACLFFLWALLLPRDLAFKIIYHGYFRPVGWIETIVLGLRYTVEGRENIPANGAYIVAMKHQSVYETLKMFHLFGDIRILLKKELAFIPLWGWYALKLGMIRVDRGRGKEAIESIKKNAAPVIEKNVPILIYPQGTRVSIHDTPETKPYKQGVSRLYKAFNIPILPVAMNSGVFWPRHGFIIRPGTVHFKILPVIPKDTPADAIMKTVETVIETESLKLLPSKD